MKKTALITGITGQDGSYLAEFLLEKGYEVIGFGRKNSLMASNNLKHIHSKLKFVTGDLTDTASIYQAIKETQPDELYNLAAQSHPGESWRLALETADITGCGAHRLFDAIRILKPDCKVYQASSSELYGHATITPQNEETPFNPNNPYAAAKLYAHNMAKIYRNSYNMFIACGILFNHESPRRDLHFITQKITYAAACIKLNIPFSPALNEQGEPILQNYKVALGNLDAKRDWGYAKDYVAAMWLMLQQDTPDDFVIGTGILRSIHELCEHAFSYLGLQWKDHVYVDERFIRPIETGPTVANFTKAKTILGWEPTTSFKDLIHIMVDKHLEK
jgi:GDPmannose 4,6-dehydratase